MHITCSNPNIHYHRHEPTEDEFWTTDPNEAWSYESREIAEEFIERTLEFVRKNGFLDKDGKYKYYYPGWDFENCIITEYENTETR